MKIALIGYGKMGKAIDGLCKLEGHEVVMRIDVDGKHTVDDLQAHDIDVAIEFTNPGAAPANLMACIDRSIPVVSGSTGWHDRFEEISTYCRERNGALFTATNFSIGVNLFFAINHRLASLMNAFPQYRVSMSETHHIHKLDSPSGTAITLATDILDQIERLSRWRSGADSDSIGELPIESRRIGEEKGKHEVIYSSTIDEIEIRHTAHTREGFAAGALQAALWLRGRKGVFGMSDLLGF